MIHYPFRRGLALWQAFITGYLTLTAGASLTEIVGHEIAGFLALLGAAANAGTVAYLALLREDAPKSHDTAAVG